MKKLRQMAVPGFIFAMDFVLPIAGAWRLALLWWSVHSVLYGWSLARRPTMRCWVCGGSGTHNKDRVWPWAEGQCRRCKRRGRFIRLGVRVITPARARRLAIKFNTDNYRPSEPRARRLVP